MSWRLVWEPGVKTVKKFQAETLNFKVKTEDKTELKWSACPHFCITLLSSSFRNFLIEFNSRKSSSYGLYHPDPGRYPFCVFQNKFMKEKKKKEGSTTSTLWLNHFPLQPSIRSTMDNTHLNAKNKKTHCFLNQHLNCLSMTAKTWTSTRAWRSRLG